MDLGMTFATELRNGIRISIPSLADRLEGILNVYMQMQCSLSSHL